MDGKGCDFLIVGAGITGLTIARELITRGAEDVIVIEKEDALGAHASGRNSGVLHAGIYYGAGTLKARFCAAGNALMKEFCRANDLTLLSTGKVIVTRSREEEIGLDELCRRAASSGAQARIITADELEEIEPHAKTFERALYSPATATVRPAEILAALQAEIARTASARIVLGASFVGLEGPRTARTSAGPIEFGTLVNAAGAYADRVAAAFGLGRDYRILPFKGIYRKIRPERSDLVRGNVYPVPNLGNPFLGVHLSRSVDGEVYVGPTAMPAFGRESYRWLSGIRAEAGAIAARDAVLLVRNRLFRSAAMSEPKKYSTRAILKEAAEMVPALRPGDLLPSSKVGIRPQLVHWPTKELVMDFVVERDDRSLHVLNAVSPAFTSSMAFARHAVDAVLGKELAGAV